VHFSFFQLIQKMTITLWPFSLFTSQSNTSNIPAGNGNIQHGPGGAAAQHGQAPLEPVADLPNSGEDLDAHGGHHGPPHPASHRFAAQAADRPARRRGAFSSETYTEEDVANYVKTVRERKNG
jgi:hypothetical protein